jgi:hypothetical protein
MSNHWHGVVTDPQARLPEFLEIFHKLVAKCQNASLGRWENLWAAGKTSVIPLESDADVLDKMAYAIANPTAAGLVKSPNEWPGLITHRFGERQLAPMPEVYFDHDGDLPEEILLEFVRPPVFSCLSDEAVMSHLQDAVSKLVREARRDGRKFVGAEGVLQQAFTASPRTEEPRRNLNPRVAAKSKSLRVRAIEKMREFARQYRAAWLEWRNGNRNAVFPLGTYALRVYACVACGPPAPA